MLNETKNQPNDDATRSTKAKPALCEVVKRIKLPSGVQGCASTRDGATLYAACIDGGVYKVDVDASKHQEIGRHGSYACSVVALENASRVISSGYDGVLRWYDLESGQAIREVKAHNFWSWDMDASANERFVATVTGQYTVGGYDYEPAPETEPSVKVFDANTGELLHSFSHLPPVQTVAFDPTGRFVAAGNRMGDVHVWDVITGKRVASFTTPDFTTWGVRKSHFYAAGITATRFTLDGRHILLAGQGEMSKPITSNGQQLWQQFAWTESPVRKSGQVRKGESGLGLMETLSMHPDGRWFVMAGKLNTGKWNVAWFDLETGAILGQLSTKNRIIDSSFNADGSRLFLAGMTGQGRDDKVTNPYGTIDVCGVTA
ncbi:MAG: WD40 repeat domain-containing protein [Planctomycetota bacterium]|jgi:WD40 repeat protein